MLRTVFLFLCAVLTADWQTNKTKFRSRPSLSRLLQEKRWAVVTVWEFYCIEQEWKSGLRCWGTKMCFVAFSAFRVFKDCCGSTKQLTLMWLITLSRISFCRLLFFSTIFPFVIFFSLFPTAPPSFNPCIFASPLHLLLSFSLPPSLHNYPSLPAFPLFVSSSFVFPPPPPSPLWPSHSHPFFPLLGSLVGPINPHPSLASLPCRTSAPRSSRSRSW